MKYKINRRLLAGSVVILYCIPLYADAGTILMWGSFLHFVIGNFLIALLESYLLSKIFHPGEKKHIFLISLVPIIFL